MSVASGGLWRTKPVCFGHARDLMGTEDYNSQFMFRKQHRYGYTTGQIDSARHP